VGNRGLKNTYIEKGTLDFHANTLFKAKQEKADSVSDWIQKIQGLGSKFREAALTDCTDEERPGILTLSDRLRNIFFVKGLNSDRIQTTVRSRNQDDFDEIAETALEEESAINSKLERYKGQNGGNPVQCSNCKKLGHASNRCYLKKRRK
jgi:homospermidine synthase